MPLTTPHDRYVSIAMMPQIAVELGSKIGMDGVNLVSVNFTISDQIITI